MENNKIPNIQTKREGWSKFQKMTKVICPYRATITKSCCHKGTKKNRGGKRRCIFNYPHNCDLFVEWVEKSEKVSPAYLKTLNNDIGDND